jgi:hypothetical protein
MSRRTGSTSDKFFCSVITYRASAVFRIAVFKVDFSRALVLLRRLRCNDFPSYFYRLTFEVGFCLFLFARIDMLDVSTSSLIAGVVGFVRQMRFGCVFTSLKQGVSPVSGTTCILRRISIWYSTPGLTGWCSDSSCSGLNFCSS